MPIIGKVSEEEYKKSSIRPQVTSPWYEYAWSISIKNPDDEKSRLIKNTIEKMLKDLNIKHSYKDWGDNKEYLTNEQLNKIKKYSTKSNKSKTIKNIKDLMKDIQNNYYNMGRPKFNKDALKEVLESSKKSKTTKLKGIN